MKRIIFLITAIFMCIGAHAATETINWYMDGNTYATTQCETGSDIILPQTPYKYGYTFNGWFGYTTIEYLESTGTQWIDTGVYANGGCIIDAIIAPGVTSTGGYQLRLGSIGPTSINPNLTRNEVYVSSTTLYVEKADIFNIKTNLINNNPIHIYLNTTGRNFIAKVNDTVLVDRNNTSVLPTQTTSIKIGYADYEGSIDKQTNYYVKIWDNNDILVRDMIPVFDDDGVPCMYDKVEGKFYYNAGTGDFIAGPVIGGE